MTDYTAQLKKEISAQLQQTPEGFMIIGTDSVIRMINPAALQILGLTEAALINQTVESLLDRTEENDTFFRHLSDAVRHRVKGAKTIPYFCGSTILYLRVTIEPVRSDIVDSIGFVVHITDISDTIMTFIANKRLANQVLDLMNSFVEVMVTAIEEKSVYNANHTKKMVRYAENYLEWLREQGTLTDYTAENTAPLLMSFWLHDIGKLLVPQEIMDKPTRLGAAEKDVRHRIETARLMLRIAALENAGDSEKERRRLDEAEARIFSANRKDYLDDALLEQLRKDAALPCTAADGTVHPLLNDRELECITVQRGTLTDDERAIIQSHVAFTEKLLSKVEFRGDYRTVPEWATGHHELLDGSGYPNRLSGDQIPWETRLLTIIDIYDALTAEDRPYKTPMPPEKAFAILRENAAQGKIDGTILEGFIESGAWKHEPPHS